MHNYRLTRMELGVLVIALTFRLLVLVLAGNGPRTPWGGGGDTQAYITLAQNLDAGRGYTYAGQASAFRPPGYPLVLAVFMKIFQGHALFALRVLQFGEGIAIALLSFAMAAKLFGNQAGKIAFIIALLSPTLVAMSTEILTEMTAGLLCSVFFFMLIYYFEPPRLWTLVVTSVIVGVATVVRSNMAVLGVTLLDAVIYGESYLPRWRSVALVILVSGFVVSPWLVRNYFAFHGAVLMSTQGGCNAAVGMITPEGRALPGDGDKLKAVLGWNAPAELENNGPERLKLPSEPVLNQQCWQTAAGLWRQAGWKLVPAMLAKLSYFWLSTEQVFSTGAFPLAQRIVRAAGVVVYWGLLALAVAGWLTLRTTKPNVAHLFLFYAILVTVMHMPLVMMTRIRMPLIDPILPVLSAAGAIGLFERNERGLGEPRVPGHRQ